MTHKLIDIVEREHLKKRPPEFQVGDTVDVHIRIIEGEKERVQVFNGVVIARKAGGVNAMFTVRRIVANEGVERVFMLHSPLVVKVEVKRHGKVRRAKLYFLRDRVGKARRLREKRRQSTKSAARSDGSSKPVATVGGGEPEAETVAVAGQPA